MSFAKRVYFVAAIYGLVVLPPQYLLEQKTGRDFPPAITHSEYFYGFIGVALAWQFAFLLISRDPVRYRPMMIPSVLEKASWTIATAVLYVLGRLNTTMLAAGVVDLVLGTMFVIAYLKTPPMARTAGD